MLGPPLRRLFVLLTLVLAVLLALPAGTWARPGATRRITRAERAVHDVFSAAGVKVNGTRPHDLVVKDPTFFRRLLADPRLRLGETYMDGMWESPAIDQLVARLLASWEQRGLARTAAPLARTP